MIHRWKFISLIVLTILIGVSFSFTEIALNDIRMVLKSANLSGDFWGKFMVIEFLALWGLPCFLLSIWIFLLVRIAEGPTYLRERAHKMGTEMALQTLKTRRKRALRERKDSPPCYKGGR